jgi:hypothetical protein
MRKRDILTDIRSVPLASTTTHRHAGSLTKFTPDSQDRPKSCYFSLFGTFVKLALLEIGSIYVIGGGGVEPVAC